MKRLAAILLLGLLSLQAFSDFTDLIIRRSTNGAIGSFDPAVSTPPFTLGTDGPFIGTADKGGTIINLCTGDSETLLASTTIIKGFTYQWYKCVATKDFLIIKGSSGYSWGSWSAIKGATSRSRTVSHSTDFASSSTLYVVYACVVSYLGNTAATNGVAFSRADEPVIDDLSVDAAYVCVGEDVVVDADFEVTGDQVDIYWEREAQSTPGVWTRLADDVDNFSFPGNTYIDGTFDYRLAIDHSCVSYQSTSLHDFPVIVQQANAESYVSKSLVERTVSTCENSSVEMSHSISGNNNFFTYTHSWEYLSSGASTWTTITSTNGGVFSGYTGLTLTVTPNSESFQDMQFRCTTIGACETIVSDSYYLNIEVPANITSIQTSQDTACVGETINFTAIVDSNPLASPVEYRWRVDGNLAVGQSFSAVNNTFDYVMGTDAVSITCEVQNGNECTGIIDFMSTNIYVYENPEVLVNITRTGCGGVTADLTAEVSKGKAPYSYLWTIPPTSSETGKSITNKASGLTYLVDVTDACSNTAYEAVLVSSFPVLGATYIKEDVLCHGQSNGEISALVIGGTVPYDITLTLTGSGGPEEIANYADTLFGVVLEQGLFAGDYSFNVEDACGDSKQIDFTVAEPNELQSLIIDYEDISCINAADGSATVSISGGSEPYNISWSNGQKTDKAVGLFPGIQIVNITDNNACFTSSQVTLQQPSEFSVQLNATNISCNSVADGTIDVLMSGGSAPYTVIVVKANNDTLKAQPFNNLDAGVYSVIATDNCGERFESQITITEPKSLQYNFNVTDVSCYNKSDGAIELELMYGVEPYSILWEAGQTEAVVSELDSAYYTVTIDDACSSYTDSVYVNQPEELLVAITPNHISCHGLIDGSAIAEVTGGNLPYNYNWSNGQSTQKASNIARGKHTVNVSDANNCLQIQTVVIEEPQVLSANISAADVTCFGDATSQIIVEPIGGTSAYTFVWSNEFDGDTINNVAAGNYSVKVKDVCGDSVELNVEVKEPLQLSVSHNVKDVSCFGLNDGTAEVIVENGVEPYIINWSNSETTYSLSGLVAGNYDYEVEDACGDKIADAAIISQAELLTVEPTITDVSCFGKGDGSVSLQASGGVEPYIYNWNFGVQAASVQALFAGSYSVNVFDANACLQTTQILVNEPVALDLTISTVNTECESAIGQLTSTVNGGTLPYTYTWSNLENTPSITNLSEGEYELTVVDAQSCSISLSAYVGEFAPTYDICVLTVDSTTGKNKIVWEKIYDSAIKEVNVYRMVGGVYQYMGSVDSTELSYYNDDLANPQVVAARYAITTTDGCGNESELSPFHQTIHLGAAKGVDDETVVLDWTKYIDESGDFAPKWYYLFRGTSLDNMVLFDSVDAVVATEYNDIDPQGSKHYKVGVKKENACVTTGLLKEESGPFSLAMSNIAEAEGISLAINDVAKVTAVYPNPTDGKFTIELQDFTTAFVDIYTIGGENILSQELRSLQTEVDLSNYSLGIYNVVVTINGLEYSQQIVIQK